VNDSIRVIRRPRRAWPPAARTAAAIIATAALALLAAACSSSPSSTGSGGSSNAGGSTSSPSAAGFSSCMRSNGIPRFPYPDSSGGVPKVDAQRLGVSSSQFNAAQRACSHLLQGGSSTATLQQCEVAGVCSPAQTQQMMNDDLKFAQCMRSHGVPNWPDPTTDQGRVVFHLAGTGIDHHSTQIETKMTECQSVAPAVLGF
jgi:hypothetical protein